MKTLNQFGIYINQEQLRVNTPVAVFANIDEKPNCFSLSLQRKLAILIPF
jgi:hypothetical protein